MNQPAKYAAYIVPELNTSRVEAQWSRIAEQLPAARGARRGSPALIAVMVASAAAAVLWWNYTPRATESVWEGSVVASDDAPVNVTLAEGTLIELDPRSEVSLMRSSAQAVQVSLSEGSARFEVSKKRSRRFSVQAGAVEVLVTGTQFRVARNVVTGGERVRVDVEEGSVEIHRKGAGSVTLQVGDHWSAFVADHAETDAAAVERQTAVLAEDEVSDEDEESPDGHEDSSALTRRRHRAALRAQEQAAEELFGQANVARRAGRVEEAARQYAELAARYPRDRRAALAAFELGRIRMDSLADVRGAVEALDRALKLDARRAFAEDALARLVLAHEALGDRAACVRARDRYLARYAEGVHAQHVSLRCGGI